MSECDLKKAVVAMAGELSESDTAMSHLTCAEFDAVLQVVVLAGEFDTATDLVINHSHGDEGDLYAHSDVRKALWANKRGKAVKRARRHVERMRELLAV